MVCVCVWLWHRLFVWRKLKLRLDAWHDDPGALPLRMSRRSSSDQILLSLPARQGYECLFSCCLVFFVVWAFRVVFFAVWAGSCFIFCCLGGGAGPAQTAKQKTRTRPNSKNINTPPPPSSALFFCCLGGWACLFFCCFGGCRFFFAVWARGVLFFAVWAGACFFLCLGRVVGWGGVLFVCCLGGGRVFFAVWAGDGSSLTYRSAWLVLKRPNNKKDQTCKGFGSPLNHTITAGTGYLFTHLVPKGLQVTTYRWASE